MFIQYNVKGHVIGQLNSLAGPLEPDTYLQSFGALSAPFYAIVRDSKGNIVGMPCRSDAAAKATIRWRLVDHPL